VAAGHGLAVIEDAAQSFGASYKGRRSGHVSTLGCTSFFPSKPLGCYGDGGAIFTDDDGLATACREIRVHGQSARYLHTRLGVGGRMDTLQCAVVLGKLDRFDWEIKRRVRLGELYRERLQGLPGLRLLAVRPDRDCVWAQFTMFVENRAQVQDALAAQGIPTAIHYPRPLHRQPAYSAFCGPDSCPNSLVAASQVLSLPMSADLGEDGVEAVAGALRALGSGTR
jgi:UDP-2-acetamido-2-deoxy-ribo-hexuluronate aminotransferase